MKSTKRLIALLAFSLLSNLAFPASVKWLVKPGFDRIEAYSEQVFKCYKNGKIHLYDDTGRSLLPNPCDSVTDFTEGYALILDRGKDETRWAIKGFLKEKDLEFIQLQGNYYTMLYSFFSEGMIAVGNSDGKYGYLNIQGTEAIPCRYQKARPFIQGWAVVQTEGDRVLYINKSMTPMRIDFHHGEVNDGTSFNQKGEAVVIHYKSKDFAVINKTGKMVRKLPSKSRKKFHRKYDRAFCEDCQEFHPSGNAMPKVDPSITTFTENGQYGYHFSDATTIPAQFSHAERFANRCAIVAPKDQYGILAIVDGDVSSRLDGGDVAIDPFKKIPTLTYQLDIPEDLQSIQVYFDKGDGTLEPVDLKRNTYSFKPNINKNAKNCIVRSQIYNDGILLSEDTFTLNVQQDAIRFTVSPPVSTSEHANHKDIQTVKSSVTNNASTPIQVAVTFTASFQANSANHFVDSSSEGELLPGETMDFSSSLLVKQSENVKVTVTANANKKKVSSSATITLTPYD